MSENESKGPAWVMELIRRDDPSADPLRFMDLKFSEDLHTLHVKRAGADGKVQSFDLNIETPADVLRLFAAESIGLIATQANRNFQAQKLNTTMAAPVTFNDEGHIVSEIFQTGAIYRRTVFDPATLKLYVTGVKSESLLSTTLREPSGLPMELAKALGVKLPLSGIE